MAVQLIQHVEELAKFVKQTKALQRTIGVVPTMGALHEGHLSLVSASLKTADQTIVTIFVNPTQFAAGEDLSKYPRTLDTDIEQLTSLADGQDLVVFSPAEEEVYPEGCSTIVQPPAVAKKLEGEFRPKHFAGVTTVVLKLFNMTGADLAFFGQKDFQQVAVLKQMVRDLNVPTQIVVCPIVRDPDGLAMSSRNVYLSESEREIALTIHQMLNVVQQQVQEGLRDGFEVITEMRQRLIDGGVDSIDYAVIANPDTLETSDPIQLPAVALVAVYVGKTRLIDNRLIEG